MKETSEAQHTLLEAPFTRHDQVGSCEHMRLPGPEPSACNDRWARHSRPASQFPFAPGVLLVDEGKLQHCLTEHQAQRPLGCPPPRPPPPTPPTATPLRCCSPPLQYGILGIGPMSVWEKVRLAILAVTVSLNV